MGDEAKPSSQNKTPPYSPRRRRPVSGQTPPGASHHKHNTSLPQLFYSAENGYQDIYHLRSSSVSLGSGPGSHDPPSRVQTASIRSAESQEYKSQQQQQQINHQPDEFITYYKLIPVYDSIGDHATTVVLMPVTKQIRRPSDGASSEYAITAPQPPLKIRSRPRSMPVYTNNSWITERSIFDARRHVESPAPHQYASLARTPESTIRDYDSINPTPKNKKSIMRHLKDKVRKLFGKKPKQTQT